MKKGILFFVILSIGLTLVTSCVKNKDEVTATDINGNWLVTCTISTCYNATVSKTITVSDGKFDAVIGSYTLYGQTESVSVKGTLEIVNNNGIEASGNEFLTGSACNGGNGFYGTINSTKNPISGDSPSSWGNIHWEKQ